MCDLAKRLAAHPRWEWRNGMLALNPRWAALRGGKATRLKLHGYRCTHSWCEEWNLQYTNGSHPDLDDPATQGVLWAMLCEAVRARDDLRDVNLDEDGGVFLEQDDGEVIMGMKAWTSNSFASVAEALLFVWGES